jgi:hypothetical protein
MTKERLQRGFFRALAVGLAAAVVFTVVDGIVEDFTGGSVHDHHGWVLVVANVIVLSVAVVVAWLALLSWRRAKSN